MINPGWSGSGVRNRGKKKGRHMSGARRNHRLLLSAAFTIFGLIITEEALAAPEYDGPVYLVSEPVFLSPTQVGLFSCTTNSRFGDAKSSAQAQIETAARGEILEYVLVESDIRMIFPFSLPELNSLEPVFEGEGERLSLSEWMRTSSRSDEEKEAIRAIFDEIEDAMFLGRTLVPNEKADYANKLLARAFGSQIPGFRPSKTSSTLQLLGRTSWEGRDALVISAGATVSGHSRGQYASMSIDGYIILDRAAIVPLFSNYEISLSSDNRRSNGVEGSEVINCSVENTVPVSFGQKTEGLGNDVDRTGRPRPTGVERRLQEVQRLLEKGLIDAQEAKAKRLEILEDL
jgi:hypothetical protein